MADAQFDRPVELFGPLTARLPETAQTTGSRSFRADDLTHFSWVSTEVIPMDQTKNVTSQPIKNVVESIIDAGAFGTLAAGLKTTGLIQILAGKGPFTVFAPSDDAFEKLPPEQLEALLKDSALLKSVLSYHVISGHWLVNQFRSGDVRTMQGGPVYVKVSGSRVQVNGARIVQTEIVAANGVIHCIDAVMLPKNVRLADAA